MNPNEFIIKGMSIELIALKISHSHLSTKDILLFQSSDNIIMPTNKMHLMEYFDIPLFVLQIQAKQTKKITYGHISDYTAPEREMYIPDHMFDSLEVNEYARVFINLVKPIVATEVIMQIPANISNMTNIPNFQSVFEYLLQNHKTIYVDKKLVITMFDVKFEFTIANIKPRAGIVYQIINGDVRLDTIQLA